MKVQSFNTQGRRVIVAALSYYDFPGGFPSDHNWHGTSREHNKVFYELDKMVAAELRAVRHPRLDVPPLVVLDLKDISPTFDDFHAICTWPLYRSAILSRHVKTVVLGLSRPHPKSRWKYFGDMIEPSIDVALENWFKNPPAKTDVDLLDTLQLNSNFTIRLAGCPKRDIGDLVVDFGQLGVNVKTGPPTDSEDHVVFCLNTHFWPNSEEDSPYSNFQNCQFHPLCIVFTNSDLAANDSNVGVSWGSAQIALQKIITAEEFDQLPVLQDLDPLLVWKVLELVNGRDVTNWRY